MKFLAQSQRLIAVLLLAITLTSGFALAAPPQNKFVSVKDLGAVLHSENLDAAVKTLNDVKWMSYQGEILPFVEDLWNLRKDKHPNVAWHIAEKPIIRLELANILLQARRNGTMKFDPSPMADLAAKQLASRDRWNHISAISVLGLTESERAVDEILKEAKREDWNTFRMAVTSLIHMCHPKAKEAVADVLATVKDDSQLEFIKATKQQWEDYTRGRTWCETVKERLR